MPVTFIIVMYKFKVTVCNKKFDGHKLTISFLLLNWNYKQQLKNVVFKMPTGPLLIDIKKCFCP